MAKHNSKTNADKTQQPWVKLIDEYTEVMSLNSFFYDAVESLYSEQELAPINKTDSHHGLIVLIRYLRARNQQFKEQLESGRAEITE